MLGNLAKGINIFKITDAVAAGKDVALVESSAIDCMAYDRMLVVLRVGATATNAGKITLYVEDSETSGGTYAEISGSKIARTLTASGETNKFYLLDTKLSKRYAKVAYQRETQNSAFIACWAILYNGKKLPEDTPSEVKELVVN